MQLHSSGELVGPEQADDLLLCTMGLACAVQLTGHDLVDSNSIVVISEGDCGDADAVLAPETWDGYAYATAAEDGLSEEYSLGVPLVGLPGNTYKVCWGHSPTVLSDYNVEVDSTAELAGPNVGELLKCTMGLQCTVAV